MKTMTLHRVSLQCEVPDSTPDSPDRAGLQTILDQLSDGLRERFPDMHPQITLDDEDFDPDNDCTIETFNA